MQSKPIKIVIDARLLSKQLTGIGNFLLNTVFNLAKNFSSLELALVSNAPFTELSRQKLHECSNIKLIEYPTFLNNNVWYQLKAGRIIKRLNANLFWTPEPILPLTLKKGQRSLVTISDFVFKLFPESMRFRTRIIYKLFASRSIRRADSIWAISNYTEKILQENFPNKTVFVGLAIDEETFKPVTISSHEKHELLSDFSLKEKFLVFVGTLEPRKNLKFLLSLMPELSKKGFDLLIIGGSGWQQSSIAPILESKGFPRENVKFAGYIDTEKLVKYLNLATAYVSTSLNEGFGLPQVEAMSCGTPVISAHNSAMIETVSGAGETVKGWKPEDWIMTIEEVVKNRKDYSALSLERANKYSGKLFINRLYEYISKEL